MKQLLFLGIFLLAPFFAGPSHAIPLLILKAPRSGSSWFSSLLNKFEGVYLTEEIFNSESGHNPSAALSYLQKAFQHPMKVYPLGPDIVWHPRSWNILGATYNPLVAWWLNLRILPDKVPDLRSIAYVRTNKVKHAIATIRSRLLKNKCLTPVITGTTNCKLPTKTHVNVNTFEKSFISKLAIDEYIFDLTATLTENLEDGQVSYVWYEELTKDPKEINKLLYGLGLNLEELVQLPSGSTGRCKDNCTKQTSDDLQTVISNYEEVEAWIQLKYPCLLPQFYETRPEVVQPHIEKLCGDLFTNRMRSLIEGYINGTKTLLM